MANSEDTSRQRNPFTEGADQFERPFSHDEDKSGAGGAPRVRGAVRTRGTVKPTPRQTDYPECAESWERPFSKNPGNGD